VTDATIAPPAPRGPLSNWVLGHAVGKPPTPKQVSAELARADGFGDDLQLALYLCYEPHYSDVPGVPLEEWDPAVIELRNALEVRFLDALTQRIGRPGPADPRQAIPTLLAADDSPSVSSYMRDHGTLAEMCDYVVHRSAYQLKEADPHTFAMPRLDGRAKQLLAEIQAGEYGADAADREMHSTLFAQTMRTLGLDDRRHAYLDRLPASALMISNLISMFGLNRRWRGALVGHLAVFEMTSVEPMGRYGAALERLGAPQGARRFYDVHVLADAEHELLALEMAGALHDAEPQLSGHIVFGAACAIEVERQFASTLLGAWQVGASALLAA
jgi:hypothetical protein